MSRSVESDEGLREARRPGKRARTHQRILEAAIATFRDRGIRLARTAEIAEAADVSPATLFNHFPSKPALVDAWLRGELSARLEQALGEAGDRGLRTALRLLCEAWPVPSRAEAGLRAEGWGLVGRRAAVPLPEPLVRAVAREQARGRLRADWSASDLAGLVVDTLEDGLAQGLVAIAGEAGSTGAARTGARAKHALGAGLRARVDLILDGARKRNERVAPPRPASASRPAPARLPRSQGAAPV